MQCKSDGNMAGLITEKSSSFNVESDDAKNSDSAQNFQKFMYELFEKNGVINDLRAYLRGHIVGVLKSAQNGDIPACQKHFTQRLELPHQALNILITEYLLRLEFSYTISVFVSEIPLANMVFEFTKSLMEGNYDSEMKFIDEDVWSILNYLGIKCDSAYASNMVEMYRAEKKTPLLLCILKCMPMYKPIDMEQLDSSPESVSSSVKSYGTLEDNTKLRSSSAYENCKHYAFCKTCQNKMRQIKEKYRKKKNNLIKNLSKSSVKLKNIEYLMRNIEVLEKSLIDEMFQQLKSVYETEMEMMKKEEDKRVKRSLVTYAMQLQKKRNEMEESFKARTAELELAIQQKKRFLWGLARALRDQHAHLARAMRDVRAETIRLTDKEESLKTQLAEAEQILRQRGEEMRSQISKELLILERHLESMKSERDSINKERAELENIKLLCNSPTKTSIETRNEDVRSHYDLLKNELTILKKYLETTKLEPKCVIERSTMTELADVSTRIDVVLNNGHELERKSQDRVKAKQVVNDLKRQKNVNFVSNTDELYLPRVRPATSGTSETDPDALQRQREENERLRTFATQQREHIDELSSQQARLQAELTAARAPPPALHALLPPPRPRTAPPHTADDNLFVHRINPSLSSNNLSYGWRKGAGEELSFFANAQPRIVVPGDTLPFIGVVRGRHADSRRYLISQWRSLRRRVSPAGGVGKHTARERSVRERVNGAGPSIRASSEDEQSNEFEVPTNGWKFPSSRDQSLTRPSTTETTIKKQETIPKCALKGSKEQLRIKDFTSPPQEKSPNAVIRDAKLRLRKLEIEAEAVEKSYLDFRRRQEANRGHRNETNGGTAEGMERGKDLKPIIKSAKSNEKIPKENITHHNKPDISMINDFDKYIKEYHAKYDLSQTHFKNNNASSIQVQPIPAAYTNSNIEIKNKNYLETPIEEFRKYYQSEKRAVDESRLESCSRSMTRNLDNLESNGIPTSSKIHSELRDDRKSDKTPVGENLENFNKDIPKSPKIVKFDVAKSPSVKTSGNFESNNPKSPIKVKFVDENVDILPKPVDNLEKNTKSPIIIMKYDDEKAVQSFENVHYSNHNDIKSSITKKLDYENAAKTPLSQNNDNMEDNSSQSPKLMYSETTDDKNTPTSPKSSRHNSEISSHRDYIILKHDSSSNIQSPTASESCTVIRKEMTRQAKELEILKQNISKIYNIPEKCITEKIIYNNLNKILIDEKIDYERANLLDVPITDTQTIDTAEVKNLLRIELQNASELSNVKISESKSQDFMLVVESSIAVDNDDSEQNTEGEDTSMKMTIVVSPKRTSKAAGPANDIEATENNSKTKDDFGEKSIMFYNETDSVNAIYPAEPIDQISNVQMQLDPSKDALDHNDSRSDELKENEADDYQDDFSADVDNFNSKLDIQYDTDDHSPISMAKTSEDDSFWDS